jgi:hypothetical protein
VAPARRDLDRGGRRHRQRHRRRRRRGARPGRRARAGGDAVPDRILDVVAPGWRGTLAPADVDAWWQSYERLHHPRRRLAAAHGPPRWWSARLGSTEHWRERWYHLISRVRRTFKGRLLYSANWDHWQEVSFWDRLDGLGVTGYFELTQRDDADVATLTAAWRAARRELAAAATARKLPLG